MLVTQSPGPSFDHQIQAASPLPLLLYRRGPVPLRALAALEGDRRVELFAPPHLTPEWVAFGQRAGACLVATLEDPFEALTFAVMSGLRARVVMAINQRFITDCESLMKAGAFACIVLPFAKDDVTALVELLEPHASGPQVSGGLRLVLDPITRTIRHQDRSARLTQREFALLHCLVSHSTPVSAEVLLRTAWGDNPKVAGSRAVLEVYVHQLRKKLALVGLEGAVRTVRGFGYELIAAKISASRAVFTAPASSPGH